MSLFGITTEYDQASVSETKVAELVKKELAKVAQTALPDEQTRALKKVIAKNKLKNESKYLFNVHDQTSVVLKERVSRDGKSFANLREIFNSSSKRDVNTPAKLESNVGVEKQPHYVLIDVSGHAVRCVEFSVGDLLTSKQIGQFGLPMSISLNLYVGANSLAIGETMTVFMLEGYQLTVAFTDPPNTSAGDLLTLVIGSKRYDLPVDASKWMNLSVTIDTNLKCTVYVNGEIKSVETLEKSPVFAGSYGCSIGGINKVFKMGTIVMFDKVITGEEISCFMNYWLLV